MKYLLLIALLGACTTTRNYQNKMQSYLGKSYDYLIDHDGIPSNELKKDDGSKIVEFMSDGGASMNRNMFGGGYSISARTCKTSFWIDQMGIIRKYMFEGYCKSEKMKAE